MSDSGPRPGAIPDPMQLWRDWYQQSEATWGKVLEQNMAGEAFAQMIGQTLDAYLGFQKALQDASNRYLETMNLPSRSDLSRLAAQVVQLEKKIDGLDEKLDLLVDQLAASGGPPSPAADVTAASSAERATAAAAQAEVAELRRSLAEQEQRLADLLQRLEASSGNVSRGSRRRPGANEKRA